MAGCLCDQCSALCCRYFALPIENPKTLRQYDDIRWYLCHENIVVFVEEGQWYLGIQNKCKHLMVDNRCGIYETRPRICRNYSTDSCDYHGGDYNFEKLFTSAEQLWQYAQEQVKEQRRKKRNQQARRKQREEAEVKMRVSRKRPRLRRRGKVNLAPVALAARFSSNGNGHPVRNGKTVSLPLLP